MPVQSHTETTGFSLKKQFLLFFAFTSFSRFPCFTLLPSSQLALLSASLCSSAPASALPCLFCSAPASALSFLHAFAASSAPPSLHFSTPASASTRTSAALKANETVIIEIFSRQIINCFISGVFDDTSWMFDCT